MERSERIATSVTPETKQRFRVQAAERGLTMSEYLRLLILEDVGEGGEDEGNSARPAVAMAN